DEQAVKAKENGRISPLFSPDDFFEAGREAALRFTGREEMANAVSKALQSGAICTADHLGALFCSQAFQGDLLFASLLRRLGYEGSYIPILSAGQVELENATYARGICAHTVPFEKQFFPFFAAKHSVQLARCAGPVDEEMLKRFCHRYVDPCEDVHLREALGRIVSQVYETKEAGRATSFKEQVTSLGLSLSSLLFGQEGPLFVYLELEEVIMPLLRKELEREDSLLYQCLFTPSLRSRFAERIMQDGAPLSLRFFTTADDKGRKVPLLLTAEGRLEGTDWRGEKVSYPADVSSVKALLEEGKIFPGFFTAAILLFFERGITWYGGYFQSCYLPEWQSALAEILEEEGYSALAGKIRSYDCKGYISGPMYALYGTEDFATPAGPVEFSMGKIDFQRLEELMEHTTLWDAHLIGITEMYFDLVGRKERISDWYLRSSREIGCTFQENVIIHG
ncbi:MAG: hypothetical protein IIZ39_08405, partial [Blautia sp.]|nr:hypothetical protein [Blautia sp.]